MSDTMVLVCILTTVFLAALVTWLLIREPRARRPYNRSRYYSSSTPDVIFISGSSWGDSSGGGSSGGGSSSFDFGGSSSSWGDSGSSSSWSDLGSGGGGSDW